VTPAAAVVTAYGQVRAALAADDAEATTKAAGALHLAAGKAGAVFAELARRVGALHMAADLAKQREAFGAVSKALITVLAADAELAKGVTCYECGMAKGYERWVQSDADMGNPYMGKRMLKCGAKVTLAP
jgi:Cu(I)/Ag(I) efflux system membrane fusion protein